MQKTKNSPKIILHICNYSAPYRGNFINSLVALEKYQDVKNIFLFPYHAHNSGAQEWIDRINTTECCAYIQEKSMIKKFFQLRKIIKKHNVDCIMRHFSDLKIDFIVKLLFKSKKVVRFFHCSYRPQKKLMHKIRCFLWNKNIMVGVSEFVANELKSVLPKQNIVAIHNAIDFERLSAIDAFCRSDKIVLTMMGWDQKGKGVDLALKATERLLNKYDVILQIIAAKNQNKIEDFIIETLGKNVSWTVVLSPTNNIGTYYGATDIFLSPSRAEAFSYAVVEAAYCENAIVASRVDGQAELKIDGAYWFENENVDDLAEKLEKAINEFALPEKVKQRAALKEKLEKVYSLEEWSKRVNALI